MDFTMPGLVVMGVSGCGKSSVGHALADLCRGTLIEGDAFHPAANIAKMSAGVPLTDEDRAGWLARLGEELAGAVAAGTRPVLACSALKKRYRDRLRAALPGLGFVFLELTREEAGRRVTARPGHFMPASLVDSQFAALETPRGEAGVLAVDATLPVAAIAEASCRWWRQQMDNASPARGGGALPATEPDRMSA